MKTAYCFDLDGTLTTTEILPCIAAELGISSEIATLTRITMQGMIGFDESLRLRTAILGQVPVETVDSIVRDIDLDPSILEFIKLRKDQCFVVTGNLNLWVSNVISSIGCRGYCSTASIRGNRVVLDTILNKADAVRAIRNLGFERIIAVGDGSNDVPMFQASDVAIAYGGMHSPTNAAIQESNFIVHTGETLCNLLSAL